MISEERVKLMTRMELLRGREERKSFEVCRMRRRDFVWLKLWKSGFIYTIGSGFLILVLLVRVFAQPKAINTHSCSFTAVWA